MQLPGQASRPGRPNWCVLTLRRLRPGGPDQVKAALVSLTCDVGLADSGWARRPS